MTMYGYMLTGPGLLSGSIGSSSDRDEVTRVAREQAIKIKRERGLKWVAWTVEARDFGGPTRGMAPPRGSFG